MSAYKKIPNAAKIHKLHKLTKHNIGAFAVGQRPADVNS